MIDATITQNRVSKAMTDITLTSSQLTSKWVFGNAQADPNTGKVNHYNAAMARAAQMALSNDEQIVMVAGEVKANTAKLVQMNNARTNWSTSTWKDNGEADVKARSDLLKSIGVSLVDDRARFTLPGTTYDTHASYPAQQISDLFSPNANSYGPPFGQSQFQPNTLYRSLDGVLFIHAPQLSPPNVPVSAPPASDLFRFATPTDQELDAYKTALQKASDKLSQFSQTEQARLQQFVTQKSMWEGLVSTLQQLLARIKGDMVAKF